ncbi:hypothetical protein Spb1_13890 [Planctopirus ephydatiae]|uniref:Uncharacterized protein n=1 Tax=Planctopirus ephydatiae TaxID=2528019 RepID=A0A518GLF0_9PLAN|nr:hypothetical protein Spb1_13890 [Planctopirus ephydatiae]
MPQTTDPTVWPRRGFERLSDEVTRRNCVKRGNSDKTQVAPVETRRLTGVTV